MNIFEGKKAVVIGGSGGIGKSIARMLQENGAELFVQGRDQKKLDSFDETVTKYCIDFEQISFENIVKEHFPLMETIKNADILVVCYGPFIQKSLENTTADDWQKAALLDYALPGLFLSTALKGMIERKWGRVLLFGGTGTGFRTVYKTNAAYAGAKTGIGVLVQSAAACYAGDGITCNAILPGFVQTEYVNDELAGVLREKMPSGNLISTDTIAETAKLLLSTPEMNGVLLKLDSGWSPEK